MNIRTFVDLFVKERYFCGLDIGARSVKACLGHVENKDSIQLVAVSEAETRGFKDGAVNDIAEFSSSISSTLNALIKKSQVRFRDVFLGVGGDLVETRISRAVIPLVERGNKVITPADVREARHQARLLGARLEEEVIHDFVRTFKVDDVNIALNPVGLYGRKLEVEVMIVVVNATKLRNIMKAVRQAGFEVDKVFFTGQVLADALLDRRHISDGAMLVDLG
ncbi:MAG: hypothetical protein HQL19_02445, partial [Candidatus Omnitrophica bacterium]|nr:hypothetical protein [Candidatus Omnitrophota bacterium]